MTFDELVAEVQFWVKRPDLDGAIRSAVRAATLKYHRKEKFWRDLQSVTVTGLTADFTQVIPIAAWFPRFRQLVSVSGSNIVEANDLFDEDKNARMNIAFLAGLNLNVKQNAAFSTLDVLYYADPIVSPENLYTSWIADTQPDLIIASAAARTLAWKGESEIFQAASLEEKTQFAELLQNNIESVGR